MQEDLDKEEEGHNQAVGKTGGADRARYTGDCGNVWGSTRNSGEDVAGDRGAGNESA